MADLIFKAGFLNSGDAATGLTVTINVYRITLSSAAVSQVVTAGSATEIGDGMYLYRLASADLSLYNYAAAFLTAGTADQSVVWCEGLVVPDALISSRSTVTAAQVNTEVDAALADYDPPTKAELDSGIAAIPAAVAAEFVSVGVVPINEDGAVLEDLLEAIQGADGDDLKSLSDQIDAIDGSYAGSGTGYYTDTIDDGTSLLDGVRVQLYTAQNRVGPAYEAYTNALGVFEMWPDPGTYYRWLDYAGVSFAQDVAVVVTEP